MERRDLQFMTIHAKIIIIIIIIIINKGMTERGDPT